MSLPANIFLTGFMGSGKTTVAQLLALSINWKYVDIDSLIETKLGKTIKECFEQEGESFFREIESELLMDVAQKTHQVISTGGGIVLNESNRVTMRKSGSVIWLAATPETIFSRVSNNTNRPVLGNTPSLEKITEILKYRLPFYQEADIKIVTDNKKPESINQEIITLLSRD